MAKIFEEPSFELLEMQKEDILTASGTGASAEATGADGISGDGNGGNPLFPPFA